MAKDTRAIFGVSLGPGDPDLITVQGLRALEQADVVYYPGSLFRDGRKASYSRSILDAYALDPQKLKGFYLEMSLAREQAEQVYERTFIAIQADVAAGRTVAVVSEGDLSTYSSFSYLLDRLQAAKVPLHLIPGISSYSLLAAQSEQPLCRQNDKVIILPRIQSVAALREAIAHHDTVILMKIRSVMAVLDAVLTNTNYQLHYGEHLGRPDQYLTTRWEDVKRREVPYFSLITIQK